MRIDEIKLKKSTEMMNQTAACLSPNSNPFFGGNNNNFCDPYFEHNNFNINNGNFLTPFDYSFSSGPPNPIQNLGNKAESSWVRAEAGVGDTTFASSCYAPPGFLY